MDEEMEALRETGLAFEAREVLEQRPAKGQALAAERFGNGYTLETDAALFRGNRLVDLRVGERAIVADGRLQTADWEEIQIHAREEARRLWDRMEFL
jgi:hypothetical protein